MSYLPIDKSTNADVSFHYFSGFSSPYYEFSVPSTLGAGVTRPNSTSLSCLVVGAIGLGG